jgi:aminoglycoside 6'-N-acetyltransferase
MPLGRDGGAAYPERVSLYAPHPSVSLRPATPGDAALLAAWDREPHVIACSSDDHLLEVAFNGLDWTDELTNSAYELAYRIAEVDGRPVGALAVCDPHTEPSHYWGEIEPNLRAIDIWIGPPEWLNRGVGTAMMTQAINDCFADPAVTAIVIDPLNSNLAAHRFYRRLGFEVVGRRIFDEDDCLVHRLTRESWQDRSRA